MGRLTGVRAIVTGAGSGIGRAVVDRYLGEGAQVVGVVRDASDVPALEVAGAIALVGDVRRHETAAAAVALADEAFGGLDVYVANAGIWDFHKRLEKQSHEELDQAAAEIIGVNLMGAIHGARAAAAALRQTRGTIIVTGSNACFRGGGGGVLYTASKFALRGMVMQLSLELAPDVRVNGVAPGATDTGLAGAAALGQADRTMNGDAARLDAMGEHIPLRRVSRPEDHAALYVTLASRTESAYVTGAMLLSDGGLTAGV